MKLPEYIENAVNRNEYQPRADRMSVTRLIGPPLIRTLELEPWDKIEEDAESKLWALDGIGFDHTMKQYSRWALTNIKLEVPLKGFTVVAKLDYYNVLAHILADLKRTSIWSVKDALKKVKHDWTNQVNVYDRLLYHVVPQLPVDKLEIHAFARDWRPIEKLRYNDYPKKVEIIEEPRWSREEQMDYIDAQLQDHIKNPRRECSDEEKWKKEDSYAVMKKERKSALRVLDSEKEAYNWMCSNTKQGDYTKNIISIVKRPGSCVRCEGYCNVKEFCSFMKGK